MLPCGMGVARSCGRGGSGGARKSRRFAGNKTEVVLKIQNDIKSINILYNKGVLFVSSMFGVA